MSSGDLQLGRDPGPQGDQEPRLQGQVRDPVAATAMTARQMLQPPSPPHPAPCPRDSSLYTSLGILLAAVCI